MVQFNYKISIYPSEWDIKTLLQCFIISLIYICLAPPASKALDKIPILKNLYPPINCHEFNACHKKFRNENRYQKRLFNEAYQNATKTDGLRLKNILKECHLLLDEIITFEKNSNLRIKYQNTLNDIRNMIGIIDWFKRHTNYAIFIAREETYTKIPRISKYVVILDRISTLKY